VTAPAEILDTEEEEKGMRRSLYAGLLVLLSTLVLASPPADALPPASGSTCNSNWVNNAGAMSCFIQGEEDAHAGVAHPHYVACTAAGEVFCCVNDDRGNQNCEAQAGGRQATEADWRRAVLAAHRTMLKTLGRASTPDLNRKSAP
jgi:hypothetical protein